MIITVIPFDAQIILNVASDSPSLAAPVTFELTEELQGEGEELPNAPYSESLMVRCYVCVASVQLTRIRACARAPPPHTMLSEPLDGKLENGATLLLNSSLCVSQEHGCSLA